jgi:outer membrane immunogenic protein
MKMKLLVAAAATVVASSAMAQSAFQGFYGQVGTGYESNSASGLSSPLTFNNVDGTQNLGSLNAPNQNFGGMPLVAGVGYNFSISPQWLIGVGADYSFLSQESSTYNFALNGGPGAPNISINGGKVKVSNRFNIFLTPGYALAQDKLIYLKAGYSSLKADVTAPGTASADGFPSIPLGQYGLASNQSKTLSGYVLGLGYKQIITSGFYGFGEVNYMSYASQNFGKSYGLSGLGTFNTSTSSSLSSYQLLLGVGYKF